MNNLKVLPIDKYEVKEWCLKKHYAKRMPMAVEFSFGLFMNKLLVGVCIFGPGAPSIPITLFGKVGKHKIKELTRLVVNDNLPKNSLSYFVSQSIKLLPKPMTLISFADSAMGHHGYIYQATNWIYCGEGGKNIVIKTKDGKDMHSLTFEDIMKKENITRKQMIDKYNLEIIKAKPKYRYLYFIGNKKQISKMKNDLLLKSLPFPKGLNKRYISKHIPTIQTKIF
tara:strand:+ start:3970 stop:4644 length:675 start_codon:yes stop_codon:yes gene_type:complete